METDKLRVEGQRPSGPRPGVRLPAIVEASTDPLAAFKSATGVGDGDGRLLSADCARLRVGASGVGRIRPTVGDGHRLAEVVGGPEEDVVAVLYLEVTSLLRGLRGMPLFFSESAKGARPFSSNFFCCCCCCC